MERSASDRCAAPGGAPAPEASAAPAPREAQSAAGCDLARGARSRRAGAGRARSRESWAALPAPGMRLRAAAARAIGGALPPCAAAGAAHAQLSAGPCPRCVWMRVSPAHRAGRPGALGRRPVGTGYLRPRLAG